MNGLIRFFVTFDSCSSLHLQQGTNSGGMIDIDAEHKT